MENLLTDFYTGLKFANLAELETYLLSRNIKLETVKKKLNIETLWNQLIYEKYSKQVEIDEKKLRTKINNFDNKKNQKELFELYEIIFQASNKEEMDSTHKKIIESIDSIGFENTANIYSLSKTSKFKGRIGWINISQVQNNIYKKIKDLENGE